MKYTSEEVLESLRECYREKDFFNFKRIFWLYAFSLEKEDREKVYNVLKNLTEEQTRMPENIKKALELLGGKIV
jgi:uncharacterized protein (DUF2225 family)